MTRLRDLPVTVVIVASIGVPLLTAVGLVTWASLDIATRNTVELTRDKAELVTASIIERTRGHPFRDSVPSAWAQDLPRIVRPPPAKFP